MNPFPCGVSGPKEVLAERNPILNEISSSKKLQVKTILGFYAVSLSISQVTWMSTYPSWTARMLFA
jgi:hypothetical protein